MAAVSYVLLVTAAIFVAFLAFIIAAKAVYDTARAVLWVGERLGRGRRTAAGGQNERTLSPE
jgi:hypothetical protein